MLNGGRLMDLTLHWAGTVALGFQLSGNGSESDGQKKALVEIGDERFMHVFFNFSFSFLNE